MPELVVYAKTPKRKRSQIIKQTPVRTEPALDIEDLKQMHKNYMHYNFLKMSGMIDDDDDFLRANGLMNFRINDLLPLSLYRFASGKDEDLQKMAGDFQFDATLDDTNTNLYNKFKSSVFKNRDLEIYKRSRQYRKSQKQLQKLDKKINNTLDVEAGNKLLDLYNQRYNDLETTDFESWKMSRKGQRALKRDDKWLNKQYLKLYGNKIAATLDGMRWANNYMNSDSFKSRYKDNDFYATKLSLPMIRFMNNSQSTAVGKVNPDLNRSIIDINLKQPAQYYKGEKQNDDYYYWTGAHEFGHHIDNSLLSFPFVGSGGTRSYPEWFNSTFSKRHQPNYVDTLPGNMTPDYAYRTHDGLVTENYADLIANRANMARVGIYDSINGAAPITLNQIQKYRKKYGDSDRLFQMYDDNSIYNMYNTIATTFPTNNRNLT